MKLSNFDYYLPRELIANTHIEPRDHSRLLVLNRANEDIEHKHFYDIADYLQKGDILVFNNSKVFKARIYGNKKTGGEIELLLIRPVNDLSWETLTRGKVKSGDKIFFQNNIICEVEEGVDGFLRKVRFNRKTKEVFEYLEKEGEMPLPPYIRETVGATGSVAQQAGRTSGSPLRETFYQNIYADKNKIGSVAAPTAGFHFTPELLEKIEKKGVELLYVTLHVGPGTFLPVKCENILEHKMHEEFFEVDADTWNKIVDAKKDKRRVIAVGTTTCRTLEAIAKMNQESRIKNHGSRNGNIVGSTNIFIYPAYDFRIVDALITNFHLPKSTLLMLVSAFASPDLIKKAYTEAINKKYRFYSFGDSMFIK